MPYRDVANLVTGTKMIVSNEMPCSCGTLSTTAVYKPLLWEFGTKTPTELAQSSQLLSKSPAELGWGLSFPPGLPQACADISAAPNVTILIVNFVASWMHLHNCRCFQDHLRMLLQIPGAHCKAPGRPGSIWKYVEALVRAAGVSGRFACGFRTELHFADWMKERQTFLGGCCTWCKLYSVYAALDVC